MSFTRLRALLSALVAVGLLAGLSACTGSEQETTSTPPPKVEVAGDFGQRPRITVPKGLAIEKTTSSHLIEGDGRTLADGDAVLLAYLAVDAVTGKVVEDSYVREPRNLLLTQSEAGALYPELVGVKEGTRILREEIGTVDKPNPLVLVYDVLHTQAWGEAVEPTPGLPTVTRDERGEPTVTLPGGEPPAQLVVATLIRGTGPQVRIGSQVTIRYTSVAWSTGEVVDHATWEPGRSPRTVMFDDKLIEGWHKGLVDAPVGSEIMLVVPPEQAFGKDTLVYVIDVLAVSAPTDESPADTGADAPPTEEGTS